MKRYHVLSVILSLILCLSLCFSMLPYTALAEEGSEGETAGETMPLPTEEESGSETTPGDISEKRTVNPGRNRPPHKAATKARRPVARTSAMRRSAKKATITAAETRTIYSPERKKRRLLRKKLPSTVKPHRWMPWTRCSFQHGSIPKTAIRA